MNVGCFRLVFDRLRGLLVPVAETTRARRAAKDSGGGAVSTRRTGEGVLPRTWMRSAAIALSGSVFLHGPAAWSDPLPVPGAHFVASGAATAAVNGTAMTVHQTTDRAILNWQSFDINAGHSVNFVQPGASSIALNRIGSAGDPASIIAGSLSANGQIYLFNQNGIIFSRDAQVNVGGLVATTLNITDDVFQKGIVSITDGSPAFSWQGTASQFGTSFVRIETGAHIRTADGGRVMLFAPRVENAGSIQTPGGQTILAAGAKVYLSASTDIRLRGFLVEVDPLNATTGGVVTNQKIGDAVGEIVASAGNVTLAGLAVNQEGRISATTTVRANGSIYLLARDTTKGVQDASGLVQRQATRAGTLTLGAGSVTEVLPDRNDTGTSVDAQTFQPSQVRLQGNKVHLKEGARIVAPAGSVEIAAVRDPSTPADVTNDSRIFMDRSVVIDVSGTENVLLPVERNIITAELRGNELRDSPLQRGGILQGRKVLFDLRKGMQLADIGAYTGLVSRGVGERTSTGGTVSFRSEGDIVVARGAVIDVSGGSLQYLYGQVRTTKVVADGRVYDISDAPKDIVYDAVFEGALQRESGGVVGRNAGSIEFVSSALVLDGTLVGTTTRGPGQTAPADVPLGGRLVVGDSTGRGRPNAPDFRLPAITFTRGAGTLPQTLIDDPLNGSLGSRGTVVGIDAAVLSAGGFSRLELFSNDSVSVPFALALAPGGAFNATARAIDIAGDIRVPSGTISLASRNATSAQPSRLRIAPGTVLSTAGLWVNDGLAYATSNATTPAWIDGGTITLASLQGIEIGRGASFDVSSGARVTTGGRLEGGNGGTITFTTNVGNLAALQPLSVDGPLLVSGYGFNRGGTLNLTVPQARIAATAAGSQSFEDPRFYQSGGFEKFRLTTVGALSVAADTTISPLVRSFIARSDYAAAPTGTAVSLVADIAERPQHLQPAAALELSARDIVLGDLTVEAGASILGDVGSRIKLSAGNQLTVRGRVSAPAGEIALAISSSPGSGGDSGYSASQSIWIGKEAVLSTAGAAVVVVGANGLRSGTVMDGGKVSFSAPRGFVVLERDQDEAARIDVSGTAAVLDLRVEGALGPLFAARTVASNAGSIQIEAREGALLDGELIGRAGGPTAAGGSFALVVDRKGIIDVEGVVYPRGDRRIEIYDTVAAVPQRLQSGAPIPIELNGVARVGAAMLRNGGFDELSFRSENVIHLAGSVQLRADRSVMLDAPFLSAADDTAARIQSAYVMIGNRVPEYQAARSAAAGDGTLDVTARNVSLEGAFATRGLGYTRITATDDIRLAGVLNAAPTATRLIGSYAGYGQLDLTAARVYPTTLSEFTLDFATAQATSADASVVRFLPGSHAGGVPLSVAGTVIVQAQTILQNGVLRAPGGSIALNATPKRPELGEGSLTLGRGSLTSVSAEGLVLPFGRVENKRDWLYDAGGVAVRLFTAPPEKRIELSAASLDVQGDRKVGDTVVERGARVDLSGGGDYYAYEFVPGLGGSTDYLGAANQYAVIPGFRGLTPGDRQYSSRSDLKVGDEVTLGAGGGLPAGTYTLLPGYYALLPGAYAVRAVPGYTDQLPSRPVVLDDGSAIVAGVRSVADIGVARDRSEGFLVESGAIVRTRAQYDDFRANDFFTQRALRDSESVPRLPRDAGQLIVAASRLMKLDGVFDLSRVGNARGGMLDIDARHIAVRGTAGGNVPQDTLELRASVLSGTGAESILIGGRRTKSAQGVRVAPGAVDVSIDTGDEVLSAGELLVAATDRIEIGHTRIVALPGVSQYAAGDVVALSGDSAFVRVSGDSGLRVARDQVIGTRGDLVVGPAVTFSGAAIELDATSDFTIAPDATFSGSPVAAPSLAALPAIALGASRISVDAGDLVHPGLVVGDTLLAQLQATVALRLRAYESLDLYGSGRIGSFDSSGRAVLRQLTIETAAIRGFGAEDDVFALHAGSIELLGMNAGATGSAGTGLGRLLLLADAGATNDGGTLSFGRGVRVINGFQSTADNPGVRMEARREVLGVGAGTLAVASDLELIAPRLRGETRADQSITVDGALNVMRPAGALGDAAVSGLGARWSLAGRELAFDSRTDLPSGTITLASTAGALTVGANAVIAARGFEKLFDGAKAYSDGGSVDLRAVGGPLTVAAGATIDVSAAAGGGNAGRIAITSAQDAQLEGAMSGRAGAGGRGGEVALQARTFVAPEVLWQTLATGGFSRAISVRATQGDLAVGATDAITAQRVVLSADNGKVAIAGLLDASGSKGGVVQVFAAGDVTLAATARIDASADTRTGAGGAIVIGTRDGQLTLASGARIDTTAGADGAPGSLVLRVPRIESDIGDDVAIAALDATVTGSPVYVEAVRTYVGIAALETSGTAGSTLGLAEVLAANAQFLDNSGAIRQRLGRSADDSTLRLRPGVEVRSDGDLALTSSGWDLFAASPSGAEPGYLTLRAAGNLRLDGNLSDGFDTTFGFPVLQSGASWSYRLIAGADMQAARPDTTMPLGDAGSGDVIVGAGVTVRTGTGTIDVAARRDLLLTDTASVIYTAGRATAPIEGFGDPDGSAFPTDGGAITVRVGRDIVAQPGTQLISNWLWRQGTVETDKSFLLNTAWWPRFDRFKQGIGALGGGDITLVAGGSLRNVSAMLPTNGRMPGVTADESRLVVQGRGDLDVTVAGDVVGGQFYVARGTGSLRVDGGLRQGALPRPNANATGLFPLLGLGEGSFDVSARDDVGLEAIVNPTVLSQLPENYGDFPELRAAFFTYGAVTAASVRSATGDVTLHGRNNNLNNVVRDGPEGDRLAFSTGELGGLNIYPGSLKLISFDGDINILGRVSLFPERRSDLQVLADGNLRIDAGLTMSDADPALLGSPSRPQQEVAVSTALISGSPSNPITHALDLLHAGDPNPVRLTALKGDIRGNGTGIVVLPKAAVISAGRDLVDLNIFGQNLAATDSTLIKAGRDVLYAVARSTGTNLLSANPQHIELGGPGRLDIQAGRDVGLGTSIGLLTRGNLNNPSLPETGAIIRIQAGTRLSLDVERFLGSFPGMEAAAGADFLALMRALQGDPALTAENARKAFRELQPASQLALAGEVADREFFRRYLQEAGAPGLVQSYRDAWERFNALYGSDPDAPTTGALSDFRNEVLFPELRAAGRAAVGGGVTPGNYARGFDALAVSKAGGAFTSDGTVSLIFSQIKTERGGNVEMVVPGGGVNVGLATVPAGFRKGPDSLGIFTLKGGDIRAAVQDDFSVNQSRVFTLEGGDILVWSSQGDIDAGRGAKTAVTVPPPVLRINSSGELVVEFPGAASGSGIGVLLTRPGLTPGDVDLIAPTGTVNAGDAGIRVAGNLTIAAVRVIGAENIQVGGSSAGVPPPASSTGAGLSGLGNVASEASKSAERAAQSLGGNSSTAPQKTATPSFITVEVLGIGSDERDFQSELKKCEGKDVADKAACLSAARKNRGQI